VITAEGWRHFVKAIDRCAAAMFDIATELRRRNELASLRSEQDRTAMLERHLKGDR